MLTSCKKYLFYFEHLKQLKVSLPYRSSKLATKAVQSDSYLDYTCNIVCILRCDH